jgi:hypothetical protein
LSSLGHQDGGPWPAPNGDGPPPSPLHTPLPTNALVSPRAPVFAGPTETRFPHPFPTAEPLTGACKHVSAGHRLARAALLARPKTASQDTHPGYTKEGLCLHNRRSEALFGSVAGAGFEPAKEYSDGFTDLSRQPRDLHVCARAGCFPRHSPRTLVPTTGGDRTGSQTARPTGLSPLNI